MKDKNKIELFNNEVNNIKRNEQLIAFLRWHRQGFNEYNKLGIEEVIEKYNESN